MADDWIKFRHNLHVNLDTFRIGRRTSLTPDRVVLKLYELASWFKMFGDYGKVSQHPSIVDVVLEVDGFANAMLSVGWLHYESGVMCLRWFTDVSSSRKSFGRVLRRKILAGAKCAACGSAENLVIDHVIPIARGGSSKEENLQPLCAPCNWKKFKRTMEEFLHDR